MTGVLFLIAFASLCLFGLPVWRLSSVAALSLGARLSVAAAAGAVFLTAEMLLFTLAEIPWSVPLLALVPLASGLFVLFYRRRGPPPSDTKRRLSAAALALTAAALLLAAFSAATARATSMDLLFFWGTKGLHFAKARAFDAAFLALPEHGLMHPGYPPLFPLLYAWAALAARRMAWGASLLTMPLFLFWTILVFRGFSRGPLGERRSGEHTALLAALLAYGLTASLCAGNAEPPLLFFETVALSALTFGDRRPGSEWLASLGFSGAVLTKVEGAAFTAVVCAAFLLFSRERGRRLATLGRLALAPLLLLGGWLIFVTRLGIADSYAGREYGSFSLEHWREVLAGVLRGASLEIAYLPWLVLGALVLLGPSRRRARPLLLAAAGYTAFILYSYMHGEHDPRQWIAWSAPRLLLTPLLLVFFAAASASGAPGERNTLSTEEPRREP